jgi:putative phosphoribosyl transferase
MNRQFRDRIDAGRQLAARLSQYAGRDDLLVLGLPRGGLPVAAEVAKALHAPLDVYVVRKLGVPWHPELAMGAIASGGILVINEQVVNSFDISKEILNKAAESERHELERREKAYRGNRAPLDLARRLVILVDDGVATGSTMRAAVSAVHRQSPARVVVAVPTIAASTYRELLPLVDELVAVMVPEIFHAVGEWYENFEQTGDDEVRAILEQKRRP